VPELRVRALKLLTRREYSRAELKAKLAATQALAADNDTEEATVEEVLDRLQAENLLSDQRYATQRVVARAGRYGNGRLRQELRQRGISDDDIAEALPEAGDETERCRAIWGKKFGRPPQSPEERAKQMRFLQYRGFSGDAIRRVISGAEE